MGNEKNNKHGESSSFFTSFITSAITSILVSIIAGLFAYSSTALSTKTDKQKAYIEFLQHKMNKLEEVQKLFDVYLTGDDLEESIKQQVRIIDQRIEFLFTTYPYLFVHNSNEFNSLSSEYASLNFDNAIILLPKRYKLNDFPDSGEGISELKPAIDSVFNIAIRIRGLISKELAETYSDFEKMTTNKKDSK